MKPNQIVALQSVALATMSAAEIVAVIRAHHTPFALTVRRNVAR